MFADDTAVVGLISNNDEVPYLEEIKNLDMVPGQLLNVSKTKGLLVDFSTKQKRNYQPLIINGTPVERVDSFRYLGVHITQDVSWSCHINTLVKKACSGFHDCIRNMSKNKPTSDFLLEQARLIRILLGVDGSGQNSFGRCVLGKGRELADMMERRRVDILCVQETRWKGSKARSIGAGFKLFYYGVDSKRNGVGVVLKEEFVRNVLEVGCELEEKERFWSELDEVMESIPTGERVVIGADFNGHVGEGNRGDEEVMGKFGVKERNLEGQMVVDFAKRMDMAVVNTYFQKREEHRVTYKSGGRRTQKKRSKIEKKTKWWKLKKEKCCEEFRQKLRQALGGQVVLPEDWETTAEVIRETGRKVLGVSSGRRKEDKETWWWNEEVQDSIQRKRLAKKKWDMDRTEENRQEYKELQRRVKREVSKAKQKAYDELYTRLDTREGEKDLYRVLTNLEKAYDRVPREELWYCMRKSGVAEKYVRVVQDMYERSRTVVRCAVGQTEEFNVQVGLHQGSALSPFLFAIVMDQLSEEVEENLERWRFALERRGMKLCSNRNLGYHMTSCYMLDFGKIFPAERYMTPPGFLAVSDRASTGTSATGKVEMKNGESGPATALFHQPNHNRRFFFYY
ncbi:hypothetical protein QTP70_005772 [Hemibagrus guttatus]|uniref:Reverse transcriptase domain-containing protein n=1 Tax=Hemibagrus guttatus TaxID=175788 RepID=A0AAE0QIB8_9TELE|nr:hypothetical protein QTP70_005772 [Hemibagrus guttatus]